MGHVMLRWLWIGGRLLLLVYVLWLAVLYFAQDMMLFVPQLAPPARISTDPALRIFRLPVDPDRADRGQIEAWFFLPLDLPLSRALPAPGFGPAPATATAPAPAPGSLRRAPLVVLTHGNGELIDHQARWVQPYRAMGFAVLLPEYRGYGRSSGKPSQAAIREDVLAFIARALEQPEVDPARVLYHGRSLGGGVAADVALTRPPQALILESTFTSVASFTWQFGGFPWLCRNPYRTDHALPRLAMPLLIMHGTQDRIIPIDHARSLHTLVPRSTLVTFEADHNDLPRPSEQAKYWQTVASFVREAGLLPEP